MWRALFLVALLLGSAAPEPALARQITLPIPEVKQRQDVWCWVAVAEMLVRYYTGESRRQCRLLETGYGLPEDYCCGSEARCRRPGDLSEVAQLIEDISGQETRITGAPPRPSAVARQLERNRAIVAAIRPPGQQIGHVVVVHGIRSGRDWAELLINGPMSRVAETIPYRRLRSMWQASIIVRFDDGGDGDFEE
jgi:hypothetical protein